MGTFLAPSEKPAYDRPVSASDSERRVDARFSCDLAATIGTSDGQRFEARAADLSFSGICMHGPQPVPTGTDLTLELRLQMAGGESDRLVLPARLVWCTPTRDGQFQLGARFASDLSEANWQTLDLLVRVLAGEIELPTREVGALPDA